MNNKGTVLIVEDNAEILELNRRLLEDEGYGVILARTVAEARAALVSGDLPDAAVLDIALPDGDSLNDLFPDLRDIYGIPALFLTANTAHESENAALRAGGFEYMTKPYDNETFCIRTARMVDAALASKFARFCRAHNLTETQVKIACLMARNVGVNMIAHEVCLSPVRVRNLLTDIYNKLGITAPDGTKRKILSEMLERNGMTYRRPNPAAPGS